MVMRIYKTLSVLTATSLVAAIAMFSPTPAAAQEFTIKIGHIASTDDEDHKGALVFQEYVQAQTNGRVKVEIYPGGTLCGNFRQCLEAVQIGAVEVLEAVELHQIYASRCAACGWLTSSYICLEIPRERPSQGATKQHLRPRFDTE